MTAAAFVSADAIRAMFSRAMSAMYKSEVPQYRALAELVARLNREALNADREIEGKRRGELDQLGMERHGAIRLGTPEELSTIRRLFMVMGMVPVGYYDLSVCRNSGALDGLPADQRGGVTAQPVSRLHFAAAFGFDRG